MKLIHEGRYYTEFAYACAKVIKDKDCTKYFKRYDPELPRITKAIGALKSINPNRILDVGSGRGRSLWPIVHRFPDTEVWCVDPVEWRCDVIHAVHKGGVDRVNIVQDNIIGAKFKTDYFDVVTALEVIEHIPDVVPSIVEMMRVSRKYIIASVPSKPDNNPEHVHFFSSDTFEAMLDEAEKNSDKKIGRVTFDYVRNSMTIFVRLEHGE
jgi:ubiquinone/menaquinone biosynthesis C-methylase UbiE